MRKRVVELLAEGVGPTEIARLCGLSRKSVYKWRDRSHAEGEMGLLDRSRARIDIERFDGELAEWLLELRRRFPTWGPKKLLDFAHRKRPREDWPARSTVAALLKRSGLIAHKQPPAAKRVPFLNAGPIPSQPNVRWSMDFKGDFRLRDGSLVKPFTLRDGASRMILDLFVTSSTHTRIVRKRLERAFVRYGMPEQIQSDTGAPFAAIGIGRLSMLSVWLLRNDVMPVLSRPGKPKTTALTSECTATTKPKRPGRLPPTRALSNVGPSAGGVTSTKSVLTRLSTETFRPLVGHLHRGASLRTSISPNTRAGGRHEASTPTATSSGAINSSHAARHSGTNVLALSPSTTGDGASTSPNFRSPSSTNATPCAFSTCFPTNHRV